MPPKRLRSSEHLNDLNHLSKYDSVGESHRVLSVPHRNPFPRHKEYGFIRAPLYGADGENILRVFVLKSNSMF